ncbi:MAG: hypothetical protein HOP19_26195 [Acidobacteria bacterium]|nr:hypothetical protein [Acidobacteriota bacterium]
MGCCLWIAALTAQAQALTVRNFVNPEAPLVREALAEITGENFTDVFEQDPFETPTLLGGVEVLLDGVPQRLRAVSPTRVVFIVSAAGLSPRALELRPKTGNPLTANIEVVSVWPSVFVQSMDENDESAFLPSGLWTTSGITQVTITNDPIPVGNRQQPTRVTITGTGWRYASRVRVWLNGIECNVSLAGPAIFFPGLDELVFDIPSYLANGGGYHLRLTVGDRESNYARINLGAAQ